MSTDWTAALHDLTSRATESYARFVAHSQDLLARVYRGELSPMSFQEHLPEFLSDRGTRFYRELTRLSFEFFNGVMILNAEYSNEYYRGLLPDFTGSAPAGGDSAIDDWTRSYMVFQARMTEYNQHVAAGHHRLMEKIARGELTAAQVQEYSRRFSHERGSAYARDSAELNFRFFDGMVRLNQRFNDDLFSRLTSNGNGSMGTESPAEPLYIEFSGPVGSVASASLVIDNSTEARSEVTFAISQFRNTDGAGPAFEVPVEIEPPSLSLAPEESAPVTLRFRLNEEHFSAGRACAATLIVRGRTDQDTLVFLVVKPGAS